MATAPVAQRSLSPESRQATSTEAAGCNSAAIWERIRLRVEDRLRVVEIHAHRLLDRGVTSEEGSAAVSAATKKSGLDSGFEPVPLAAEAGAGRERLDITFRSDPDPPASGDNTLEVTVADRSGRPVTDADVSVVFYMAPMPTMSMPAMQTDATLSHQGGGVYRGGGEVMMAGRWDVTVLVSREGQRLHSRTLTIVAR